MAKRNIIVSIRDRGIGNLPGPSLEKALNAAGLGVCEWDLKSGTITLSVDISRWVMAEPLPGDGFDLESLVHPDDHQRLLNIAQNSSRTDPRFEIEFRMFDADGEIRWMMYLGTVEYDTAGSPVRLIGTIQDITKRREIELQSRQFEVNLRALVEASTLFTWQANVHGESDELFAWLQDLSGRPITSIEEVLEIIHPEDVDAARQAWELSVATRTVFTSVCRFLSKDRGYRYLAIRGVQLFDDKGNFQQWIGTFNDITDRKSAEEALRKNEAQLQLVADSVPVVIAYLDKESRFLFANKACLNWFGLADKEIVGRHVADIVGRDIYKELLSEIESVLKGAEVRLERAALIDRTRYVQLTYKPDLDSLGNTLGYFLFIIDLTESRQAEERLRKSQEQLRQAQKLESIGRLAGGIAHDFNNMLTAINGYSELALSQLNDGDPLKRNIEEIKKAGERSANLTRQLLAFSRQQLINVSLINLNQAIIDSTVMIQRVIGEDIQIETDLYERLWTLKGDKNLLTQILLNLVVNARDAMPRGGIITISTQNVILDDDSMMLRFGADVGPFVKLSVSDTGIGMDDETKKQIFEPFFTTKETGKGTGLGLSMVYGIVKQLDGYVWVESEPNGGTTFDLYFPRAEDTDEVTSVEIHNTNPKHGTETVLLVEDEDIVRELSSEVLRSCGYKVIEASSGKEALRSYKEFGQEISLLMTDVVMPGMNGEELAKQLLSIQPELKILYTSGYIDNPIALSDGLKHGAAFIQKPFTNIELARKIRAILDEGTESGL